MTPRHHAAEAIRRIRRTQRKWSRENRSDQCGRGCSACCHQPVGTLICEGVIIAAHYRAELEAIDFAGWPEARRGYPCVFLLGGECQIYAHRPISCATLVPAGRCGPDAEVKDAREPVHRAREIDAQFCRRAGLNYPGPLLLAKAIEIGRALLDPRRAAELRRSDLLIDPAELERMGLRRHTSEAT